jgi:hypothetical protein
VEILPPDEASIPLVVQRAYYLDVNPDNLEHPWYHVWVVLSQWMLGQIMHAKGVHVAPETFVQFPVGTPELQPVKDGDLGPLGEPKWKEDTSLHLEVIRETATITSSGRHSQPPSRHGSRANTPVPEGKQRAFFDLVYLAIAKAATGAAEKVHPDTSFVLEGAHRLGYPFLVIELKRPPRAHIKEKFPWHVDYQIRGACKDIGVKVPGLFVQYSHQKSVFCIAAAGEFWVWAVAVPQGELDWSPTYSMAVQSHRDYLSHLVAIAAKNPDNPNQSPALKAFSQENKRANKNRNPNPNTATPEHDGDYFASIPFTFVRKAF